MKVGARFRSSIHLVQKDTHFQTARSYLINGFVAGKPQNRYNENGRKVMIWLSFKSSAL